MKTDYIGGLLIFILKSNKTPEQPWDKITRLLTKKKNKKYVISHIAYIRLFRVLLSFDKHKQPITRQQDTHLNLLNKKPLHHYSKNEYPKIHLYNNRKVPYPSLSQRNQTPLGPT